MVGCVIAREREDNGVSVHVCAYIILSIVVVAVVVVVVPEKNKKTGGNGRDTFFRSSLARKLASFKSRNKSSEQKISYLQLLSLLPLLLNEHLLSVHSWHFFNVIELFRRCYTSSILYLNIMFWSATEGQRPKELLEYLSCWWWIFHLTICIINSQHLVTLNPNKTE